MATSRSPDTLALVVDSNVTSRGLLSAQLRDYGVTKVGAVQPHPGRTQ